MPKRKRIDEELNQPFPQGLSSSCNSNAFDALDEPIQNKVDEDLSPVIFLTFQSASGSSNYLDALELRNPILGNVMEALVEPNTHLLGVYGSDDDIKDTLLEKVRRRIARDELFDLVLTATVTKKPDARKSQDELARQLRLTLHPKSKDERAKELKQRIENDQKILIVLCDIPKKLDLGKVGIPYSADHTGCKILLTSKAEDVLSNHMHTQKTIML